MKLLSSLNSAFDQSCAVQWRWGLTKATLAFRYFRETSDYLLSLRSEDLSFEDVILRYLNLRGYNTLFQVLAWCLTKTCMGQNGEWRYPHVQSFFLASPDRITQNTSPRVSNLCTILENGSFCKPKLLSNVLLFDIVLNASYNYRLNLLRYRWSRTHLAMTLSRINPCRKAWHVG